MSITTEQLDDLAAAWPDLEQVPAGRDVFPDLPIARAPAMPPRVYQTLLAALAIMRDEVGGSEAIDEARAFVRAQKDG